METTYTWESAGHGATRMTLRNHGSPAGFSRLFAPFMATAMRRANRKDLAALRALLERNRQYIGETLRDLFRGASEVLFNFLNSRYRATDLIRQIVLG